MAAGGPPVQADPAGLATGCEDGGVSLPPVPPPRRKHLMDPDAPRPVRNPAREQQSLTRVQQWVLSSLAVTTILHLSVGLILAAIFLDDPRRDAQVGLNMIAAAFGVIAVAAFRAIHGKTILSPWLALGLVPGAIGLWLTLG